ncbi:hypothetical protein ACWIG4_18260 [Streptomyces sp. NPDC002248]
MLLHHPNLPPEQTIDVPDASWPVYERAGWARVPAPPVADVITPPANRRHTKKED